ncbi:putative PR domain zinc finger protein 10 [Hypsibius exemplaris]|uniref:PR domain zinc finger protein 10 n=1 Tax=Hypsibius exemplaris TaxID=2072580 RepID=A0A1W0WME4_HYPEX|nr:putative PR domain zinc finger protein 10 [Hypsibius exemplaris]
MSSTAGALRRILPKGIPPEKFGILDSSKTSTSRLASAGDGATHILLLEFLPDQSKEDIAQPNPEVFCTVCGVVKEGPCCVFHTNCIADSPIQPFAYASLPKELQIDCRIGMKQKGVFTKVALAVPSVFGPLIGDVSSDIRPSSRYYLEEEDGSFRHFHLDSDQRSNWMKFVRPAESEDKANLLAFQQNGQIYFASTRAVDADEELRVAYAEQYGATAKLLRRTFQRLERNVIQTAPAESPMFLFDGFLSGSADSGSTDTANYQQRDMMMASILYDEPSGLPEMEPAIIAANDSFVPSTVAQRKRRCIIDGANGSADAPWKRRKAATSSDKALPKEKQGKSSAAPTESAARRQARYQAVLEAVIAVNPYQFPLGGNLNRDAWTEVLRGVAEKYEIPNRHSLQVMVSTAVLNYQKCLEGAGDSAEELSRLKAENPLQERIMQLRNARPIKPPTAVAGQPSEIGSGTEVSSDNHNKSRLVEKLKAVIAANPFQFHHSSQESHDSWLKVYTQLFAAGVVTDKPSETAATNLRSTINHQITSYRSKGAKARSTGEDHPPSSPADALLCEVRVLWRNRPRRGTAATKRFGTPAERAEWRLWRSKAQRQRLAREGNRPTSSRPRAVRVGIWWRYRCDVCPAEFRTQPLLTLHGVKHGLVTDASALSTTCPACEVAHASLDELMDHIERHERRPSIHHKVTPFQCTLCLRYYSSQEFLDRHIRRMHTDSGGADRQFECATCREKFFTLAALRSHERVHTARKFFECPVCLLGFPSAGEMQEHSESHRVAGQFPCRLCTSTFPLFRTLRCHMRGRHFNRAFTCEVCRKTLLTKASLDKHSLVHQAVYAFECATCGRKFKRKCHYDDHLKRLHNPDRIYSMKARSEKVAKAFARAEICRFCTRQYASRERLLIHQRAKHLEQLPMEDRFASILNRGAVQDDDESEDELSTADFSSD